MLPTQPEAPVKKPVRIALCMPVARAPHMNTVRSLLNLKIPRPFHFLDAVNQQVDVARNMLTEAALAQPDVTHLLWVDDDMTFDPDALERLLAHDLPVVGGLCFGRRHPYPPILIHMTHRGHSFQYQYPEGLVKVDATGGAFLLVKREVFEAIIAKYGAERPWEVTGKAGEDIAFCERARECGFDVMVDTTVKIGHMAEVNIMQESALRNRVVEVNPYYPPHEPPEGAPVASIVIPTFNQNPNYLHAAVQSAVQQTVPVEIILIDSGSEFCVWCSREGARAPLDGSPCGPECPGGPKHPHFKMLRLDKNPGTPWPATNLGVRHMTTDWFCWLSSDDLYYPMKVEKQLAALATERGPAGEACKAAYHGYDLLIGERQMGHNVIVPYEWKTVREQRRWLAYGCAINGLTAMIHKDVFAKVGSFSEEQDYRIVADWEFWNRIGREFFWLPVKATLATRRNYGGDSERFAKDPEKSKQWVVEDARVREKYAALVLADEAQDALAPQAV